MGSEGLGIHLEGSLRVKRGKGGGNGEELAKDPLPVSLTSLWLGNEVIHGRARQCEVGLEGGGND